MEFWGSANAKSAQAEKRKEFIVVAVERIRLIALFYLRWKQVAWNFAILCGTTNQTSQKQTNERTIAWAVQQRKINCEYIYIAMLGTTVNMNKYLSMSRKKIETKSFRECRALGIKNCKECSTTKLHSSILVNNFAEICNRNYWRTLYKLFRWRMQKGLRCRNKLRFSH